MTKEYLPAEIIRSASLVPQSKAIENSEMAKAWTEMNSDLQYATQKIREMLVDIAKNALVRTWAIGKFVREIRTNEKKYDFDPVDKIGRALGYAHRSTITKAERFYEWMPDENKVQEIANKRTKLQGDTIGWQRLELMTQAPRDKQNFLIKQTLDNDLTVEELRDLIDKVNEEADAVQVTVLNATVANVNGSAVIPTATDDNPPTAAKSPKELRAARSRRGVAGRKHRVNKRELGRIIESIRPIQKVERQLKAVLLSVDHGLGVIALSIPADKITPDAFTKLDELIEATQSLEATIKSVRTNAEACKRQWQTRANQQAQQNAARSADAVTGKPSKRGRSKKHEKVRKHVAGV